MREKERSKGRAGISGRSSLRDPGEGGIRPSRTSGNGVSDSYALKMVQDLKEETETSKRI